MSKICNRNYSQSNLYTTKLINDIKCCPNCEKPTECHQKTIEQRAWFWALSGDTGISSEAIAKHMANGPKTRMMPPSDADDRRRCIRLLELIPEWIPRLKELVQYDQSHKHTGITINASGISAYSNSWSQQIPLIVREGKLL